MKKGICIAMLLFCATAQADITVTPGNGITVKTSTVAGKEIQNVVSFDGTTIFDYNGTANITFVGYASPGTAQSAAAWKIKKLNYDTSVNFASTTWCNGTDAYINEWDTRIASCTTFN